MAVRVEPAMHGQYHYILNAAALRPITVYHHRFAPAAFNRS